MDIVFINLLETGLYAGFVVLAVLILRIIFGKAPKSVLCALWILVGLRLVLVVPLESSFAVVPRLTFENALSNSVVTENKTLSKDTDNIQIQGVPQNEAEYVMAGDEMHFPDDTDLSESRDIHEEDALSNGVTNGEGKSVSVLESSVLGTAEINEPVNLKINDSGAKDIVIFGILGYIWIAGFVSMLVYGFVKSILLKKRFEDAVRLEGYDDVYLTDQAQTALVFGLIRPRIYMNFSVRNSQKKYIIAHEREHISRRDHIAKAVAYGLLSIYWFVPWVWLAFILYSKDMELACDEGVIKGMKPEYRAQYAETLFDCSSMGNRRNFASVSFGELRVNERVKNIMKYKKRSLWISITAVAVAVGCLVLFLIPEKATEADNKNDTDQNENTVISTSTGESNENVVSTSTDTAGHMDETNKVPIDEDKTTVFDWFGQYFDKETKILTLPEGIESIPPSEFLNCTEIKEVIIPDSVTEIGNLAFAGCTNLEKVKLPAKLLKIGNNAFHSCSLLKEVICPPNLETIGDRAFDECRSLEKVELSGRILRAGKGIGKDAFSKCYFLPEETKATIIGINKEAYRVEVGESYSDLMNVDYSRKEAAPEQYVIEGECKYVVLFAMDDDGFITCREVEISPDGTNYTFSEETTTLKLSPDCKIIVKAKDEKNNGKICYIDRTDLAYIIRTYGLMMPDGNYASVYKSEYVYPFMYVMGDDGVIWLREYYDMSVEIPDLVKAKGKDGTIGYIRMSDITPEVHTIEEALESNEKAKEKKTIPLYNWQGEIIGEFSNGDE